MKKIITITLSLMLFMSQAQVGINTDKPDPSAILDLGPGNRGLIAPRVNLQAPDDVVTIPNPANGLSVVNTNPTGDLSPNSYYYFDGETSRWQRLISKSVADSIINEIQVPVYVGQINKLNSQVLTNLNGQQLNIIKFDSNESVFNSNIIEFLPGSDTTFKVKRSGNYIIEGFANLQFTSNATTFWTVAIQAGISDDSNIAVPSTFLYGMRCPSYLFESSSSMSTTCNIAGAVYLAANTVVRMIAVRKNGATATTGVLGPNGQYAASLKLTYFPISQ